MPLVVIVGQGYVGLPLSMRAVAVGHNVVGFDVDEQRVKRLAAGDSYVEDVRSEVLNLALASGRYLPTTDGQACGGFDVGVITVPTPLREGVPDLSFIESAGELLGRNLRRGSTVVLESTTYPGTTVELLVPILEETSGLTAGEAFHVGYSPERIDPGNRVWSLMNTPKVVSGIDDESLASVRAFYDSLVGSTVPVSRTQEAELVKLIENTFRHVNVALVNEIAMFAADLGIDVWEALEAAKTKPFGFMGFTPGPGVGGHCLPVDPSYLSWRVKRRAGETFRFVELANDVNDHMPRYVVRRVTLSLNRRRLPVNGTRLLLLGLAYKSNTGDSRESPALVVADQLVGLGAEVRAVDPYVEPSRIDPRMTLVDLTAEELCWADCVIVLTDHDVFDWQIVKGHAKFIFDTRHRLDGANVEHL
ncbi:MAG TPA: nucleotide sugar dehydrogenase [Acidimicrobiales bacterium]